MKGKKTRNSCTFGECTNRRVVSFAIEWRLFTQQLPFPYAGLTSETFSIAPCIDHLEALQKLPDPAKCAAVAGAIREMIEQRTAK